MSILYFECISLCYLFGEIEHLAEVLPILQQCRARSCSALLQFEQAHVRSFIANSDKYHFISTHINRYCHSVGTYALTICTVLYRAGASKYVTSMEMELKSLHPYSLEIVTRNGTSDLRIQMQSSERLHICEQRASIRFKKGSVLSLPNGCGSQICDVDIFLRAGMFMTARIRQQKTLFESCMTLVCCS
jgi:hypothetical protein